MAISEVNKRHAERMRQVAQRFRSGELAVLDVPIPQVRRGGILIRTTASVVSAGTERSKVVLAKKSLVGKAMARPDQVKKVLAQIQRDGLGGGLRKAFNKLNAYSPLGYSAAGTVIAVGEGVSGIAVGDRVACGGAGYANHAEYMFVPKNLVVPIPDNVDCSEAAFATVGAIALHGVRQADIRLGERVAVIGLGLIGLLTVQLLRAAGCVVVGIEPREDRRLLGERLGVARALHPDQLTDGTVRGLTDGMGFDAAIITAASGSGGLLPLSAHLLRDRGRVVVVGDVPIETPREVFYRKEIELRLSRSYGPGRYDRRYEEDGCDYPIGYVRWTEQRNMAEVLRLLSGGELQVKPLVSRMVPVSDAVAGYEDLKSGHALALVLQYEEASANPIRSRVILAPKNGERISNRDMGISVIGAGSYMGGVLMPTLQNVRDTALRGIMSAGGLSAEDFRRRYGFAYSTARMSDIMEDTQTRALIIATPHREHGSLVHAGLAHGKAVFVEKPLAMTREEVRQIAKDLATNNRLMVGYNRRFSRHTELLRMGFRDRGGSSLLSIRVNGGFIDGEHWIQDTDVGGGRIIGEVCHFVDLAQHLVSSPIVAVFAQGLGPFDRDREAEDNLSAVLTHTDGSITTILYTAKGDPAAGKERIEMFADGTYGEINDFKSSIVRRSGKVESVKGADKGQRDELKEWLRAVRNGAPMPISPDDLIMSTVASLAIIESLRARKTVTVSGPWD